MTLDVPFATNVSHAANTGGPLLECLLLIARAHQITSTRETLLAGLPLESHQLTPSLFTRAAKRAGLTSKIVQRDLLQLNSALFPAVLLLNDNQACVLLAINAQSAQLLYPDLGDAVVDVPLAELANTYTGRAIYVRPQERVDARTAKVTLERRFVSGVRYERRCEVRLPCL